MTETPKKGELWELRCVNFAQHKILTERVLVLAVDKEESTAMVAMSTLVTKSVGELQEFLGPSDVAFTREVSGLEQTLVVFVDTASEVLVDDFHKKLGTVTHTAIEQVARVNRVERGLSDDALFGITRGVRYTSHDDVRFRFKEALIMKLLPFSMACACRHMRPEDGTPVTETEG